MSKKTPKASKPLPNENITAPIDKKKDTYPEMDQLMLHYSRVRQDMDTRRTRKNGWNEIVTAYMGRLPANWPFISVVTDPRIRTTILEKTARLLNGKLQGKLIPRNEGSLVKAKIMNSILDFNWDVADQGGSMIEKVALTDQTTRMFGAGFNLEYWDTVKNINESKVIDQRDIGFDGSATHIRNARWVQVREFTSWDKLAERGYDVKKLKRMAAKGEVTSQFRSSSYEDIVKANRGLQDRVGELDDPVNPILEIITEYTPRDFTIFLPRGGVIVDQGPNPYKHGKIPITQLRYYPLGSDIYGESEVESVLPIQRAINALLCGFIDEMILNMRPPLKVSSTGVRIETIQYGPGALWVMQNPNLVREMEFSPQVIAAFNSTYPALIAAFNTAMGDQSLGISTVKGKMDEKTATEVNALEKQQNNRDQYNQLYLAEFLKDKMMMWVSNIQQYMFDDPEKKMHVMKILGKDKINEFSQMKLDGADIPDYAIKEIQETIKATGGNIDPAQIDSILKDIAVPTNPVIENPEETDPEKFIVHRKLEIDDNMEEAKLYITKEDMEGDYDYIADVTSMATGTLSQQKAARAQVFQTMINPTVIQQLAAQQMQPNMKDTLIRMYEDAGINDAEMYFEPMKQLPVQGQQNGQPGQNPGNAQPAGFGGAQGGQGVNGPLPVGGIPQVPQAPNPSFNG